MDIIETILIKIFNLLPDANPDSEVLIAVSNAFAIITPTIAKIDLIFPVVTLFKILLAVFIIEMTLLLITLVLKIVTFIR
ncbi:MAG: hypothetical protein CO073_04135 [Candidatus Komeilibacteria bacterium CG_4_9_14_0_8_um_filter_36_9]|uniref:Uncharacterized protein n=1 Tax=Candidatus Komeilibacteria bacterium CG_4_9_14_0_8_um_filter_36_9 TaxID=1974473 RepID=A0A2M8DQF0_9BACT|nr:MAG: hypothetical protein CO073_04135 [Candidatus Komeilibacteria bacterium CG_4_9_14_0_8_um_filter_36_9]